MTKKEKQIYAWTVVIIIAALGLWFYKTQQNKNNNNSPASSERQNNSVVVGQNPTKEHADVWVGTLKESSQPDKGNLVLETSAQNIYIKTNRDYSALINKTVRVSYSGSVQNFVLGDITLQENQ